MYKSLLGSEYIEEELDEKLKALANPDENKKGGRLSSLQKKKGKTSRQSTKATK